MATFSYILCICCDLSQKNGLILFIFGTLIGYHVLLMHIKYNLDLPNLSNYTNMFLKLYVYCDISEKNRLILFIFGYVPKCSIYVHYIISFVCL